jgi:hypothetical protein
MDCAVPNRILREGILTSERVNALSWPAEVFYRRLISVVDDFGRYYAKPDLLRAACYALKLDIVGNPDVVKWLDECSSAGLVRKYTVDGKAYLELIDFKQQVRAAHSKFPQPLDQCVADATQTSSRGIASAPVVVVEVGDESGVEGDGARKRGTRLPADWALPAEWRLLALKEQPTWTPNYCATVATMFKNYWTSKSRDAAKLDWKATWHNWVIKEGPMDPRRAPKKSLSDALEERDATR